MNGRGGSCFADASAATRAIAMALPMIEAAVGDHLICGSGFFYIVVMDPGLTPDRSRFEAAVLVEHAVGDRQRWDADYAAFARQKADLSWRHRLDTHLLQSRRPHALIDGDTLLAGGVWLDGIAVGVSGAEAPYDVAFATAIAANLRALSAHRFADALNARRTTARGETTSTPA